MFPNQVPDPTPQEIAERTATIREDWDEETHRKRAGMHIRHRGRETVDASIVSINVPWDLLRGQDEMK